MRLHPLLRAPLHLRRDRERRQDVAERVLEELGFSERMWSQHFHGDDFAESTFRLAFAMTDGMVGVIEQSHETLFAAARRIASAESMPAAERTPAFVQALCDLGWGDEHLPSGTVRTALDRMTDLYVRNMGVRLAQLFERWDLEGRLSSTEDASAR